MRKMNTETKYIFGPNGHVAKIVGNTKYYYHSDHLGSLKQETDDSGNALWSSPAQYDPFGEMRSGGPGKDGYFYTGKLRDTSTGLYYYGARYYDPKVGRFITKDLSPGEKEIPISLNPYTYVWNNPLKLVDSDGKVPDYGYTGTSRRIGPPIWKVIAALVGAPSIGGCIHSLGSGNNIGVQCGRPVPMGPTMAGSIYRSPLVGTNEGGGPMNGPSRDFWASPHGFLHWSGVLKNWIVSKAVEFISSFFDFTGSARSGYGPWVSKGDSPIIGSPGPLTDNDPYTSPLGDMENQTTIRAILSAEAQTTITDPSQGIPSVSIPSPPSNEYRTLDQLIADLPAGTAFVSSGSHILRIFGPGGATSYGG